MNANTITKAELRIGMLVQFKADVEGIGEIVEMPNRYDPNTFGVNCSYHPQARAGTVYTYNVFSAKVGDKWFWVE